MPQLERVAKVTVYHYRKPGVSAEEFYRRMNEEFVPLTLPIIQRNNVLKFGLNHSPAWLQNEAADAVALKGWTLSDHDGSVEYWVRDIDHIKKGVMIDPDWTGKVSALEDEIGDKHRGVVHVQFEEVYIENGKIINLSADGKSTFPAVRG